MQKDNAQRPSKGISTDSSYGDQPKETYTFALNAVDESEKGDLLLIGNENSNKECGDFHGFIPLSSVYILENRQLYFLVSPDNSISEIGILDDNCNYTPLINDYDSIDKDKFKFTVNHQVDATHRIRKGCEDIVYFTDGNERPMSINISNLDAYKNNDGTWNSNLALLQKRYKNVPKFYSIDVLDSGGHIEPGSVNVSIQYIDEELNPTEWIVTSDVIKIYNDLTTESYPNINGSIKSSEEYFNYPTTNKSIRIKTADLDSTYLYYRLAFIIADSGSGLITKVEYTEEIPTSLDTFIYTGNNAPYEGDIDDIAMFASIIYKAKHIEQIDNSLLLSSTEGIPVNLCKLQKYASKIQADCVTRKVKLNDIKDPSNPKNGSAAFNGLGYMPGEIYSFGIVYVFENGDLSPVYHIPGKSPNVASGKIFEPGLDTYPMAQNNEGSSTYVDNIGCGSSFWGNDSENIGLKGKYVRHHRFPLRTDIGVPLVSQTEGNTQTSDFYNLMLTVTGDLLTPVECDPEDEGCITQVGIPFSIRVKYTVNGEEFFFITTIDPNMYTSSNPTYTINVTEYSNFHSSPINMGSIVIEETDINGVYQNQYSEWETYFSSQPTYIVTQGNHASQVQQKNFSTEILGIKFSNVEMPDPQDTEGLGIIGYYIVRNERTELDKTIIDSGILVPTITNSKYISTGLLQPEFSGTSKVQKDVWALIHPEHKFNGREYVSYDSIIQQGNYTVEERKLGKINYGDIYDGTTYNSGRDRGRSGKDEDGFSLDVITRDNILEFNADDSFQIPNTDIKERFYLSALESRSINDNAQDVYNIAVDNKIGIVQFENDTDVPAGKNLPYVLLQKDIADPYSNFRVLPYYKDSKQMHSEGTDTVSIFGGDTYVSSMRYVNSCFWDIRLAKRAKKRGIFRQIIGFIALGVGILLAGVTGGGSLIIGAGIALAGAGLAAVVSGITVENVNKAFSEEYEKGLRETLLDDWVSLFYQYTGTPPFGNDGNGSYGYDGPSDDTIQWLGEALTDVWFESSVNMALRHKMTSEIPSYLESPGRIESGNNTPITTWEFFGRYFTKDVSRYPVSSFERHMAGKLLTFDPEREDGRLYLGTALGEVYKINPDYDRWNREKKYYHIPLEYECCSNCREQFPTRVHYSEQSFQEELTDHYRVFLPNNYIDINAENGNITNMFKMSDKLFVHTSEGLWALPNSRQERVNEGIVTYIGTGSFFSVPPVKIVDGANGTSAGLQHKWSALKTPYGYFFVCENQRMIYKFDGKGLDPISNKGTSKWFLDNIPIVIDKEYKEATGSLYPYRDNPSNRFGTGFISTYDAENNRIIFTKKDKEFTGGDNFQGEQNDKLISYNNLLYVFSDFKDTVNNYSSIGYDYDGIKGTQMVFSKPIRKFSTGSDPFKMDFEYAYVNAELYSRVGFMDNSWTMSYSLKKESWTSLHSYLPSLYSFTANKFYSWNDLTHVYEHNVPNEYGNFYGKDYPFIIEYVSNSSPMVTRIWNHLRLNTIAYKDDPILKYPTEQRFVTFNKMILYNSRQCSGLLNLVPKDTMGNQDDYLSHQVVNLNNNSIVIDRNEKDWTVNDLRDIRVDYSVPIWNSDVNSLQNEYYIDKILNTFSMDVDKSWDQLESFRDKYLVIRFIFDNFVKPNNNVKLIVNYSVENEQQSLR